jgi:hypothetical protein
MADMYFDVDTALSEVPVNLMPLLDDTDFKTRETAVAYNAAGMDLVWNFVTSAGAFTQTAVTPTTGGNYDWTHQGDGIYTIEIPASGGASINNDTEGYGWFTGVATGVLPWRGPVIGFRAAALNDALLDGGDLLDVSVTQWNGSAVATPDSAGHPKVTIKSGTGTGEVSLSSGAVTAGTVSDKTGYALSNAGVDAIWDEAGSGHLTANSMGAALFGSIALSGTIGTGGNETTTVELPSSGRVADDDYYNNMILEVISGTGAGQSEFISDYTAAGIATLNGTLATALGADSVVQVRKFGTLPGASAPTADQNAAAVWNKLMADHNSEGSFGSMLQGSHSGQAQGGGENSITLDASGSSSTNNHYRYQIVSLVSGTGAGQSRQITAYDGTSKAATVDPAWTTQPIAGTQYVIKDLGIDAATTTQIAAAVWNSTRATYQSAGTFGEYVIADSTRISGSTTAADALEAATTGATPLPANVTQISGDSVAADNLESYTDGTTPMPVNTTHISGDSTAADNLEAALDGTGGVTIDAAIEIRSTGGSAGHNASDLVSSMLTTAMTESYAADGAAPTVAQALLAIQQFLLDKDVSGTTLTVRRLDGTTSAFTLTLNDGTNPTDINRTG